MSVNLLLENETSVIWKDLNCQHCKTNFGQDVIWKGILFTMFTSIASGQKHDIPLFFNHTVNWYCGSYTQELVFIDSYFRHISLLAKKVNTLPPIGWLKLHALRPCGKVSYFPEAAHIDETNQKYGDEFLRSSMIYEIYEASRWRRK